jgi:hypothetical protein
MNGLYVKEIQPKQLLPQHIQQLIQTKNKARKKYHRTLDPNDKTHLNRAANELKHALREYSNKKWTTLLENTKIKDNSLWRLTKKFKQTPQQTIPPFKKQNRTAITHEDKLEMITETFEEQFTPNQANTLSHTKDTNTNNHYRRNKANHTKSTTKKSTRTRRNNQQNVKTAKRTGDNQVDRNHKHNLQTQILPQGLEKITHNTDSQKRKTNKQPNIIQTHQPS